MSGSGVAGFGSCLSMTRGDWPVDSDVVNHKSKVADALRLAGAIVEEVSLPWRGSFLAGNQSPLRAIFGPESPRSGRCTATC